jgi:hypothetical protein
MSQRLQSEMHLDADQLNAFAEGALPAQAREETLAHLAVCADCREVLSLSLPPMEDIAQAEPARARKPWFSGWNLACPVAMLAGLIVVTLYLRTRTVAEREGSREQTADVSAPPVLPAQSPKAAAVEENKTADKEAASRTAGGAGRIENPPVREGRTDAANEQSAATKARTAENVPLQGREVTGAPKIPSGLMAGKRHVALAARAAPGSVDVTALNYVQQTGARSSLITSKDLQNLSLEGRDTTALLKVLPGSAVNAGSGADQTASSTSAYDPAQVNFGGVAGSYSVSGSPVNGAAAGVAAGSGNAVGVASSQGMARGAPGGTAVSGNVAAAPPPDASPVTVDGAKQPAKPSSMSETVTVSVQSAEIATSDAKVAGMIQPAYVPTLQPLPSGLPATSVASEKRQMVAIDLHNNVYISKNGGKRWKQVAAPWQGRAVKVQIVPPAVEFELTTDHDGVWVSPDGRSWRRK